MTSDSLHKKSFKKISSFLLPVLLTLLFLYFAFREVNLKESFSIISQTSLWWLIFYLIIFFASHYVRALRWKVMIRPVKPDVSSLNLFGAVMIGYGVNCVVPRLGEIYRGMFLGKWENISRSTMIGTVVVERIIDLASFAFASLLSVYLYKGNLFSDITWLKPSLIIGFTFILLFTLFVVLLVRLEKRISNIILNFISKINPKMSQRTGEILSTLIDGFSSIKGTKNIFSIVVLTILIFLFYTWNTYFGFYMLGMEKITEITFSMAWVFMTISAYGVLIPTPGGTGSYHIISIFVLSQLYSFNYEVSAAYAILTHFIQYVVFIISTILIIVIVNKFRASKGENKENFLSVFNSTKIN